MGNSGVNDKILENLYNGMGEGAVFSGVRRLYEAAKEKIPSISRKDVIEWLKKQFTYTFHKSVKRKFRRNPIFISTIDEQWLADPEDMQIYAGHKDGYRHILTIIDTFSKYGWAKALETKSGSEVSKAFEGIFEHRIQGGF